MTDRSHLDSILTEATEPLAIKLLSKFCRDVRDAGVSESQRILNMRTIMEEALEEPDDEITRAEDQ